MMVFRDNNQAFFKNIDFYFLTDIKAGILQPFPPQTDKGDKICIMPEINRIMIIRNSKSPRPDFWFDSLFSVTLHKADFSAK